MGHRANFVVVRDRRATAYYDNWAAMGCIHTFSEGPEVACNAAAESERTDALMSWCNAEGGYLIDFDKKKAIVFGHTLDPDLAEDENGKIDNRMIPFMEGGLVYLQHIAPKWRGWSLAWEDGRGVDAFATHLRRRRIKGVALRPNSHPAKASAGVLFQA